MLNRSAVLPTLVCGVFLCGVAPTAASPATTCLNAPITLQAQPATTAIVSDGVLDDAWLESAHFDNFAEFIPDHLVAAGGHHRRVYHARRHRSICRLRLPRSADRQSRASFTDRDGIFDDDFVGIVLDTYRDHKRAYAFFSNAHGIQGDMLWYANRAKEDGGFDAVWESAARTYEDRWVVEMRIPRLRTDADDLIVHQRIFRHGLQYQFTRELFIRFVGELNRTRRATAVDAYESSTSYSFEPMLSYRMDAFSVFLSWG